jgi:hypothetical protein
VVPEITTRREENRQTRADHEWAERRLRDLGL